MIGIANPAGVMSQLAKVEAAGLMPDYLDAKRRAICHRGDLGVYPEFKYTVEKMAQLAHSIFGGSPAEWKQAACEVYLPDTYIAIALQLLDEFEQRVDEAAAASRTSAKMARERGRGQ
jgi:hypothetical protein